MKNPLLLCILAGVLGSSLAICGCAKEEDKTPTINQIDKGLEGLPPADQSGMAPMGGGGKKTTPTPEGQGGGTTGGASSAGPPAGGPPTK